MAAVASLQAELKSLGHTSKRHNAELAQSSEKSLSILEAVSQSFDNDQQIITSLRKYEDFITPFILACSEASAKSCASALQCIQTLATYKAIAPSRLQELLKALLEATQLGLGIQLKILQVLPVILFEFAGDLTGPQVVDLLHVCAELLGSHKVAMVHNAAYATLQQLITGVFDRTQIDGPEDSKALQTITIESASFEAPPRLHDAAMIWLDLCDIAEKRPTKFLKIDGLSLTFTLELLELTLSNQAQLIHKHEELATVVRTRVIPLLLRLFSESSEFPIILRVVRVFYLLLRQHLDILTTESEVVLSTLAQGATQSPPWKRVLCLEVLQGVLMDKDLFLQIYLRFDKQTGKLNVLETIASGFASALCEDNGLILASEISKNAFDLAMQNPKVTPSDEVAATLSDDAQAVKEASQIITKYSSANTPVIEMLDRVDPPKIKHGNPYYLIIKCLNSLADDVHRLASAEKLDVTGILDLLATPVLRSFSVALGVAMDLELFRLVVRAVQRMAHASGIASKSGLRDEFIMLLTQYCYVTEDSASKPWLLGRCSLCVRALFNLGYALGNQLGSSWSLITTTVFRIDGQIEKVQDCSFEWLFGNNGPEYRNMNAALKKLVESTLHHSDEALIDFMNALGSGSGTGTGSGSASGPGIRSEIGYRLLGHIVEINVVRFGNPESKCWEVLARILLEGVKSHSGDADSELPLEVLNEASMLIMQAAYTNELYDDDQVDRSLTMILKSVCQSLEASTSEHKIGELQHLNTLLDKFGSRITSGWGDILAVVSKIPQSTDLGLMRSAFHTLELICSDFLGKLPYPCIFDLTLCLNEYSRQTTDLNTSFTSASLFWSVCDQLMARKDIEEDVDAAKINSESDLIAMARDYSSKSKRIALWLFAVAKLASISERVHQQQVRISAVQIFLRLFNTHGSKLPLGTWNVAYKLVFPTLLNIVKTATFNDTKEMDEFCVLAIDGISRLHLLFLSRFTDIQYFQDFWKEWLPFLDELTGKSAAISLSSYGNLRNLLESSQGHNIPLDSVYKFWVKQPALTSYSAQTPKQAADALRELVKLFESLRKVCEPAPSLDMLADCALFPFYTTSLAGQDMSSLQAESAEAITSIEIGNSIELRAKMLSVLNRLAIAPYTPASEEQQAQLQHQRKPDFRGLSKWAQSRLGNVLQSTPDSKDNEQRSETLTSVFAQILAGMNTISCAENHTLTPTEVVLHVLKLSPDLKAFDSTQVVQSVDFLLSGYNTTEDLGQADDAAREDTIRVVRELVSTLKSKPFPDDGWNSILFLLLKQSVIYERSIHNTKYYEHRDSGGEDALLYGSIDTPRLLHHPKVSFYCLSLLRELGLEDGSYSKTADDYFRARAHAVLSQYIGDTRLLGQEPMRSIISSELIFVLKELIATTAATQALSNEHTHKLVLESVTRAHREILPLLQKILS